MKEQKLVQMKNSIDKLEKTMELVIQEINSLRQFSVSVLEVSKRMPSYDKAVKKLRSDIEKEKEKMSVRLDDSQQNYENKRIPGPRPKGRVAAD